MGGPQGQGVTLNLTNSPVGQLAARDISNVAILQILEAAEAQLDRLDADPADTADARRSALTAGGRAIAGFVVICRVLQVQ